MAEMPPGVPSILRKIVASKRDRLAAARAQVPLADMKSQAEDAPPARDFAGVLSAEGIRIIAEMKRRSPSRGIIREDFDVIDLAGAYREGGADAYSILTEQDHFDGRLDFVGRVREVSPLPILRKDFLFDPYQIYESRMSGADAVLLIAACLTGGLLTDLLGLAQQLGLATLVEVHSEEELDTALEGNAPIIGINNRNLHTFDVDLGTAVRLAARIPENRIVVGESGIHGPDDVRRLAGARIDAILVGEHFMRSSDVASAVRELKGAMS